MLSGPASRQKVFAVTLHLEGEGKPKEYGSMEDFSNCNPIQKPRLLPHWDNQQGCVVLVYCSSIVVTRLSVIIAMNSSTLSVAMSNKTSLLLPVNKLTSCDVAFNKDTLGVSVWLRRGLCLPCIIRRMAQNAIYIKRYRRHYHSMPISNPCTSYTCSPLLDIHLDPIEI